MATSRLSLLVPRPHQVRQGDLFPTPNAVRLDGEWANSLPLDIPENGVDPALLSIRCVSGIYPQGYRLLWDADGGRLEATDRGGAWNGLQTARQWWQAHRQQPTMPTLRVEDRPDFERRGVTLDVSRCRVPTLNSLKRLIDRLAGWKLNQLQLYTEHTFAYAGHDTVWQHASPLTGDDIRELSAYAAEREMTLVPNQNSLGHFHRWLKHSEYRHLAECPDGIEHPFSPQQEPYGLCATDPEVFELLRDLYGQLLPHFGGDRLNVGCDEPIDLGTCRSCEEAERRGKAALYLDYVLELRDLAARWDRRLEIWADAALADPEMLDLLPADVRLQIWGYEADHDFASPVDRLTGHDFDVCPGTSSWASLAGRSRNATANICAAAAAGDGRAGGLVVTDWGDFGHPQPPSVSLLGYLAAADCAWNSAGRSDDEYCELLEQALGGFAGRALCELGRAHETLATPNVNGTPLFHLLFHWQQPLSHDRYQGLDRESLQTAALAIEDGAAPDGSHPLAAEIDFIRTGLTLAVDLGLARLQFGDAVNDFDRSTKHALAERLASWRRDYATVWLSTSRPGGLSESVSPIDGLLIELSS